MTNQTYVEKTSQPADIKGWDAESLKEFDRRWLRGDTQKALSKAFRIDPAWVNIIRIRRGLPARGWPYRRPPKPIIHTAPKSKPQITVCDKCRKGKRKCTHKRV